MPLANVIVHFLDESDLVVGKQLGLIMSNLNQTVVFTPFDHNKMHFTHSKKAYFIINDTHYEMNSSRYSLHNFLRVWDIVSLGINNKSECINFVKKRHYYSENEQINLIQTLNFTGWPIFLPPIYLQEITNTIINIGTAIYHKNSTTQECKISGMVIMHKNDNINIHSIVIDVYILKQIMDGVDDFYSNIYYLFELVNNKIYVKENWDLYENLLHVGDRLLQIENTLVDVEMHNDEINKKLHFDTWITMMYMKYETLDCKILRNNQVLTISIPRIPVNNILQYKYYSENLNEITFEKMHLNPTDENVMCILDIIHNNPKKLYN